MFYIVHTCISHRNTLLTFSSQHMSNLSSFPRLSAATVVAGTCILALLHFGRDFLEPLSLALILSLVIAPLVRMISKTGMGHMPATLVSVLLATVGVIGISAILASQIVFVTADLPQYRVAIQSKLEKVRDAFAHSFNYFKSQL